MRKILFIGCGNLGTATLSGMITSGKFSKEEITILLPKDSPEIEKITKEYHVKVLIGYPLGEVFDVILLMVKPQTLDEILPHYYKVLTKYERVDSLIISPAAGKTLAYYSKHLPGFSVVRTMPNINAKVARSITVGISNQQLSDFQKQITKEIFESIGKFIWIEDEKIINLVNAISGSGPAYFYLFVEFLTEAGIYLGIKSDLAKLLAEETFIGAALTLDQTQITPQVLREMVTSPKGTTHAAISEFKQNDGLKTLIFKAALAAKKRAEELAI